MKNIRVARLPSRTSDVRNLGIQRILNPPQAVILAVGGIEEKPVVEEGK